jgi:hypothetical protein
MTRGRDVLTPAPDTPPAAPLDAGATVAPLSDALQRALPTLDEATLARLRAIRAVGAARGMRDGVFAKIGDSITESGSFGHDIGHGWTELGAYSRLETTVRHFSRRAFSSNAEDNSFSRASAAATAGWTTEDLLQGGDGCPAERELRALRPGFAVVMIGTNDVERVSAEDYERNLREVLRRVEARSVVPVLSTIPDHRGTPEFTARSRAFNGIIRRVASSLHIPLLDYHAALASLPNAGLSDDNIHPSAYVENGDTRAGVFTPAGLRNGYNVRNLTLLLMLERLIETVGARA